MRPHVIHAIGERPGMLLLAAGLCLLLLSGCASARTVVKQEQAPTVTQVQLKEGNYRTLKAGASGVSYGFRLFGIIPFANPTTAKARQALYESLETPLTGRATALANVKEDRTSAFFLLFSVPKVVVTADVIEYLPSSPSKP